MQNKQGKVNLSGSVQHYTHKSFLKDIENVCNAIKKTHPDFNHKIGDVIVAIPRGGLVPATYIAHQLNTQRVHTLEEFLDMVKSHILPRTERCRILLIDDISDSGATLRLTKTRLKGMLTDNNYQSDIATVTLMMRYNTSYEPSCYSRYICHDKWIIFPWEPEGALYAQLSCVRQLINKITGVTI